VIQNYSSVQHDDWIITVVLQSRWDSKLEELQLWILVQGYPAGLFYSQLWSASEEFMITKEIFCFQANDMEVKLTVLDVITSS
jgi:hypothetical protein